MRIPESLFPLSLSATLIVSLAFAQTTSTIDVGSGAPNSAITIAYQQAFYRNGFVNLVSLPPLGNVKAFGTTGLVQEFADAAKSQTNKYALIKANASIPVTENGGTVLQVYGGLYTYYTTVGVVNVGFPTGDTLNCPNLASAPGNTCIYQLFDKPYALFAYKNPLLNGNVDFAVRDPFYTKWQGLGGIAAAGPATSAEQAITAASGIAATLQTFDQGAVFNITSGTLAGRLVGVGPTVYAAYSAAGGYTGFLGLPISDEALLPNGAKRQSFEGGFVDYTPGSPAVAKRAIQDIIVTPSVSSLKLALGDSINLTATPFDALGNALTDRAVVWSTSNSRVVSIQATGQTAILKALAGGVATITVSAEGKSSIALSILVSAPCCGLGEGAPTPAIQQSFQDAITRNRISVQLPIPGPVQRAAGGYVQTVQDANGTQYLIAIADRASAAYILTGPLLAKYVELGGPSGSLGYPLADVTAGGHQLFQNQAALAGNPAQVVSGNILSRWAALNYEAGPAGPPVSAASGVLSFRATIGNVQAFRSGLLVETTLNQTSLNQTGTGPSVGNVFFVSGLVLAAYLHEGGAAGTLGLPLGDEFASGGKRQQDFEGGSIDYSAGDSAAAVHPGDRRPLITAAPTQTLAGSKVRLAIGGFNPGSTVRVSVTGQPDFTVKTDSGAYLWDVAIPANAAAGVVKVHAVDLANSAAADGSYTVRQPSQVVFQVIKVSGDGQTGGPGSVLPLPLRVLVKDDTGSIVPGMAVNFQASPGAQIVSASASTDALGMAEAVVRLPPSDAVALVTATAGRQVVTFSAQAAHTSVLNFPRFTQINQQINQQGSQQVAAIAAILRYYQNRGDLPNTNGFADPQVLNQFLQSFCVSDSQGGQICEGFVSPPDSQVQFVNLGRVAAFVGGNLSVHIEKSDAATVRDLVSQGNPVLLALTGAHFVVATGVAADGGILIMDPDPVAPQTRLNETTLAGVVRLIPQAPTSRGFEVTGNAPFSILSPAGPCGTDLNLSGFHQTFCETTWDMLQLVPLKNDNNSFRLTLTDLGNPSNRVELAGSGPVAYTISHLNNLPNNPWTATPASLTFAAAGVVNAASFTPALSPGALFTVFGSGLSAPSVEIGGMPATVIAASPFQVSGQIPAQLAPGTYSIKLSSQAGTMEQSISLQSVSPAIFTIAGKAAAILNQDRTLNTPDNPAKRGQVIVIFGTGLGAVVDQGNLKVAQTPVTVALQGLPLTPSFAGLAPGYIGLYQINVTIPVGTPPGSNLSLALRQGNATSNPVEVAVQ